MRFVRRSKKITELNMTPMIDMVFLLLIFFMVATTMEKTPGIRIDLPGAKSAQAQPEKELVVYVDRNGRFYFGDEGIPVSRKKLYILLKKEAAKRASKMLIIKADEGVKHGKVVEVMDIANMAGIRRLAIATRLEK